MSALAERPIAWPCGPKMPPLAASRSPRSMPALRGMAPTSSATSASPKATSASSVRTISLSSGKAQSSSSIATPSSAPRAGVISNMFNATGWSGPSMAPDAIRKSNEYPICPAAPVTATRTGALVDTVRLLLVASFGWTAEPTGATRRHPNGEAAADAEGAPLYRTAARLRAQRVTSSAAGPATQRSEDQPNRHRGQGRRRYAVPDRVLPTQLS